MSKIFGVVLISVIHLLFISTVTSANDATVFNYFFSAEFYNEENLVFSGFRPKTHGFKILENNVSIMCKNQVLFYLEDQDNEVLPDKPHSKIDDIDNFDHRDLTIFNKDRFFEKFFPGIKTLFGNLKGSDDTYTIQVKFSDTDNDPPASNTITCTSSAVSISFEFLPAGPTSYNVKTFIKNASNNQPAADSPVEWSLKPSTDCSWTDDPDSKTDTNGKAEGCFNVSKPTRVSVIVTHIPSGISGTGTFTFKGYGGTKILPWKNLEGAGELCEWSSNGYFAVRQATGLSIYRVSDWEKVYSKNKGLGSYHGLIFSPDGSRLVTDDFNGKGEIVVLNVPDGSIDRSWDVGCKTKAADRSFGWRDNYIYAVHNDNLIRKWSNPGALNTTFNHNDEIRELRFNPANDSQFAAVDNYGELRIWNTESPSPVKTIDVESGSTVNLECLAWSHDGTNLSVGTVNGDTGVIYTYNTLSWSKSGFTLPGLGAVNSLDYNNDSSRLAIGHSNGLIVYNLNTYTVEYYNSGSVKHVRWSPASRNPDGCMLAAGGQVYVFDDYSCPQVRIFSPESGSFVTSASVEIVGKISDPHDIRSATASVNRGAPVSLSLDPDGSFTQTVSLIEGRNTILIQAQDIPENESSYTLIVNRFADALPPVLTEPYVDSVIRLNGTGSYDFGTTEKAGVTKEPEKDKTATLSKTAETEKNLTIQVAAFNDQKLAVRMVEELKKKGYHAYRIIGKTPGKVIWHKVRIGYFKNRAKAEATLIRLKKDKINAIIVGSKKM